MRPPSIIDLAELFYDALTRRHQPRLARVVAEYLDEIPAGGRVLDLGSGSGRIAAEVERATAARITACDVDFGPIRHGGASPSGGTVLGDGQALPFAPRSFAATYLVYVLHHVPDQARLLAEVRRVLAEGGRLILVEFDSASGLVRLFRLMARLTGRRCRFHTPGSLVELARRAGFETEVRRLDRATFVVVGVRRGRRGGEMLTAADTVLLKHGKTVKENKRVEYKGGLIYG